MAGSAACHQLPRFVDIPQETRRPPLWNDVIEHSPGCRATDLPLAVEQQGTPRESFVYSIDEDAWSARVIRAGELVETRARAETAIR